ncbi:MAG: helicase RepA family protein [Chloroflexota bacterium]|nr:helicase RepA family protein [Chloroflexota bacterium]
MSTDPVLEQYGDKIAAAQPADRPALTTITAADLLRMEFPEPRWAVRGLIPEGLSLLVSKPKLGKSWMLLNIGIAIGSGGRALGSVEVEQGEVLYLALEDPQRRLQSRLITMLGDGEPAPASLHLRTDWPRLDEGGGDELEAWLEAHPAARWVAIDTLQKLRAPGKRDGGLYEQDYAAMGELKAIGDRYQVALTVAHHDRKLKASDPFDTISGTQGLAGGADALLVMQRNRGAADAILHLTGRDVEEASYALRWAAGVGTWSILDLEVPDASSERIEILNALKHLERATPTKVADWIGRPAGSVKWLMWRMGQDGQLDGGGQDGYVVHAVLTANPANPEREATNP